MIGTRSIWEVFMPWPSNSSLAARARVTHLPRGGRVAKVLIQVPLSAVECHGNRKLTVLRCHRSCYHPSARLPSAYGGQHSEKNVGKFDKSKKQKNQTQRQRKNTLLRISETAALIGRRRAALKVRAIGPRSLHVGPPEPEPIGSQTPG